MYFNSYIFILAFLPITLWGYYLINKTKKYGFGQMWLLGASFVFVGYLNIYYVLIIMFSIVTRLINKYPITILNMMIKT